MKEKPIYWTLKIAELYATINEYTSAIGLLNEALHSISQNDIKITRTYELYEDRSQYKFIINDLNGSLSDSYEAERVYFAERSQDYSIVIGEQYSDISGFNARLTRIYSNRALIYDKKGDYGAAVKSHHKSILYSRGISENDYHLYHGYDIINLLVGNDKYMFDNGDELFLKLSQTLINAKEYADAKIILDAYVQKNRSSPPTYELGIFHFYTGSQFDALTALNKYINYYEEKNWTIDNDAFIYRARTRFALGDFLGAITDSEKALELSNNNGLAWSVKGSSKILMGLIPEGCLDLSRSFELSDYRGYELFRIKCNNI
jgi:hypothetical protein